MKYNFKIIETYSKSVEVDAESEDRLSKWFIIAMKLAKFYLMQLMILTSGRYILKVELR